MFHSRQLARAPSKFARRSSLLDLQPACSIACCGFIRLLKSCSAHSALNSFVSNFPTVARETCFECLCLFFIKTFKNTVMGRVGGVGGGATELVCEEEKPSLRNLACAFLFRDIYSHRPFFCLRSLVRSNSSNRPPCTPLP